MSVALVIPRSPLERMGSYAEPGQASVRLAATPYTTGQVLLFAGGLSLA